MELNIIYEDNHLIVVNKPAGMLVQGDDTGDVPLVEHVREYIRHKYNKPGNVFAGLVHRLDRPVSGVVVLTKTSKALARMNQAFAERKVQKIYWAAVKGLPSEIAGHAEHWLLKLPKNNTVKAFDNEVKGSQSARLDYKVVSQHEAGTLIEVKPITGRPHQIRVQLACLGCPIINDTKYGGSKIFQKDKKGPKKYIMLHARSLSFRHPTLKQEMTLTADPDPKQWNGYV